jgi:hypothetical protein
MTLVRTSQAVCGCLLSPFTPDAREIADVSKAITAVPSRHVPGWTPTPLGTAGQAAVYASGSVQADNPFEPRVIDRIAGARSLMSLGRRAIPGVPQP